jgi:TPR repeat
MQSTQQEHSSTERSRPKFAADQAGPVYFVLHVPKTAGQTIQVHLAEHCAPGVFWLPQHRFDPVHRTTSDDLPDFDRVRVVSGHEIGRSLEEFYHGREIRRILMLRDPLQLQISLYNWMMMNHLSKGLGTYSFELRLQSLPRNFVAHFLLSRWLEIPWLRLMTMTDSEKYDILNQTLANFWFVGAHSDCDRVIKAISADLGVPPAAIPRNTSAELQAHTGWELVTAKTLPPATRDALMAWNSLDQALWESWGAAGFEPAKVRPVALRPKRNTFWASEMIRPWFQFCCFVRREWMGRRPRAVMLDRANRARDAGEWELAVHYYRETLRAIPNASAIWVQYGHALKECGRVAEAEQAYRQSLNLKPDTAETHLHLGHALKLQARIGEAETAYVRAAVLDPALDGARNELIGLGWSARRIAQTILMSFGTEDVDADEALRQPLP